MQLNVDAWSQPTEHITAGSVGGGDDRGVSDCDLRGHDGSPGVAWAVATGQARAAGRTVPPAAEKLWALIAEGFE